MERKSIIQEVWHKWSLDTARTGFDDKSHSNAGRGEDKLCEELRTLGYDAVVTGQTESFDVKTLCDGLKYEVKELADIRIEKTGLAASQETLRFFRGILNALEDTVREIEFICSEQGQTPPASVLGMPDLSFEQLREFVATARSCLEGGSLARGLIYGSTVYPISFVRVMNAVYSLLEKQKWDSHQLRLGFEKDGEIVYILDEVVGSNDILATFKSVRRFVDVPSQYLRSDTIAGMFSSNLKLYGMRQEEMDVAFMKQKFFDAFDPRKILGDIDRVVIVDREQGFFVFDVSKFDDYYVVKGLTKTTQGFSPVKKLWTKVKKPRKARAPKQLEFKF